VAEAKLAMNCGLIEVPMDEAPIHIPKSKVRNPGYDN
jgi:hypothetical protein